MTRNIKINNRLNFFSTFGKSIIAHLPTDAVQFVPFSQDKPDIVNPQQIFIDIFCKISDFSVDAKAETHARMQTLKGRASLVLVNDVEIFKHLRNFFYDCPRVAVLLVECPERAAEIVLSAGRSTGLGETEIEKPGLAGLLDIPQEQEIADPCLFLLRLARWPVQDVSEKYGLSAEETTRLKKLIGFVCCVAIRNR